MTPIWLAHRDRLMARLMQRMWRHVPRCRDLRGLAADAWQAVHLSPDRPFVIEVEIGDCLGLGPTAFRCDAGGGHPFVDTLQGIADGQVTAYDRSPLADYYARWQPATAAEVLGITDTGGWRRLPPLASPLPWDHLEPAAHLALWTEICERDYRVNGFDLTVATGWKGWGPIAPVAGEAEFERLRRIFEAIRRAGYQRHAAHDGDIMGQVLCDGPRLRYLLGPGQHRIAALAVLGHQTAPLRLDPHFIRRSDAELWPNVRRGYYTAAEARALFDRIFAGRQPWEVADRPESGAIPLRTRL